MQNADEHKHLDYVGILTERLVYDFLKSALFVDGRNKINIAKLKNGLLAVTVVQDLFEPLALSINRFTKIFCPVPTF